MLLVKNSCLGRKQSVGEENPLQRYRQPWAGGVLVSLTILIAFLSFCFWVFSRLLDFLVILGTRTGHFDPLVFVIMYLILLVMCCSLPGGVFGHLFVPPHQNCLAGLCFQSLAGFSLECLLGVPSLSFLGTA